MLVLDMELPAGALVMDKPKGANTALLGADGLWLRARVEHFDVLPDGAALGAWRAQDGHTLASPVEPNTQNARLDEEGASHEGLQCTRGLNCGYMVPNITDAADQFSMAVIFEAGVDATPATLLTLNTSTTDTPSDRARDYLHLTETEGQVTAQDTVSDTAVQMPSARIAGRKQLLLVTVTPQSIALQQGADTVQRVDQQGKGISAAG